MDFRELLVEEFDLRQKANKGYSLRAFSRDINISPALCSGLLKKKKTISENRARLMTKSFRWSQKKKEKFINLLRLSRIEDEDEIKKIKRRVSIDHDFENLDEEVFSFISEWQHAALLEMIQLKDFKNRLSWFSRRLGMSQVKVKASLQRLLRLGFVKNLKGRIEKSTPHVSVGSIASKYIRFFHRQSLNKAFEAIETQSMSERDFSSITMAIDESKLKEAQEMIKSFRRELMDFLEGGKKTEVYQLSIQLFRLTHKPG